MKIPAFPDDPINYLRGLIDNRHAKKNDIAKVIISFALNKLAASDDGDSKFNDGYNMFRDFNSKKLYVYNAEVDPSWPFAIRNLTDETMSKKLSGLQDMSLNL